MKKMMMALAFAGLIVAGCKSHTESSQGAGGYNSDGTMGTGTSTNGGTLKGTDQGTSPNTPTTPVPDSGSEQK